MNNYIPQTKRLKTPFRGFNQDELFLVLLLLDEIYWDMWKTTKKWPGCQKRWHIMGDAFIKEMSLTSYTTSEKRDFITDDDLWEYIEYQIQKFSDPKNFFERAGEIAFTWSVFQKNKRELDNDIYRLKMKRKK